MRRHGLLWLPSLLWLLCPVPAPSADADSFRLTAGFDALADYYPGYLANGYASTLTTPRGTEAAPAYLVGLMDYAEGDMSRPAMVPGWSQIDFSPGASDADAGWLNRAALDPRHFQQYSQTLDLHEALLTTRYHYVEGGRDTAITVSTLVSEASPHLAAMQFSMTPDYDGTVRLSFGFMLWAQHAPRFPLARLTGADVEQALAANQLSLQPRPPASPDRAALWYPGHIEILRNDGDAEAQTLWLDGRAQQGQAMAMAAAVALPPGVPAEAVRVHRDAYTLALELDMPVRRGQTYVFAKYLAQSRAGWGGSAADDLLLARHARELGFEQLLREHRAAWAALWQSDIEIEGDKRAQQLVHSELYYLLASSTADSAWGLGACGLTTGYAGHIFWDSDTWIFPALLLLHPERAKSLVDFRWRTLAAAQQRASERGFEGAMYPWESDPDNGSEQTPHSAFVLGETEIHVNADVAIAQWQYYLATQDRNWLRQRGWPVIREVARFWASRAHYDASRQRYDIVHVNSVAESHSDIPNDTFTNLSAARALRIAAKAARVVGERADRRWLQVADGLFIPRSADGSRHLPFDPGVPGDAVDFGGGPLILLYLPSLDLDVPAAMRRADYASAVGGAPLREAGAVSMGIAPRTIAAAMVGERGDAEAAFASNFSGGTLKPPFNVRTETAYNNAGYFLTGSGGYLQSLIFGFSGLRLRQAGLVAAFPPLLPDGWQSLTLRNVHMRHQVFDVRIARAAHGALQMSRIPH